MQECRNAGVLSGLLHRLGRSESAACRRLGRCQAARRGASAGEPGRMNLRRHAHGDRRDLRRRFDDPPGMGLFQDLRRELRVQRMSRPVSDQMADDRIADQREIADRVATSSMKVSSVMRSVRD